MRFGILVFIIFVFATGGFAQDEWPMVSGGPARTSWADDEWSLSPPFDEIMTFDFGGPKLSAKGDTLYIGRSTGPNSVVAVDIETGEEFWTFEIDSSGASIGCVPAVSDSLLFCGGQGGVGLFAVDRFTGTEVWRREIGSLYTRNPIVDDDRVYVIKDSLYCFDAKTGTTVWNYPISGQYTPSVDDSCVYVSAGQIIALDKFDGTEKWTVSGFRSGETVAILDDRLFIQEGQSIVSRNKADGSLIWSHEVVDASMMFLGNGLLAVSNDALVFDVWQNDDLEAELRALDVDLGTEMWRVRFDTVGVYTPTIANNVVYAVEWKARTLWGFDLTTGSVLFSDVGNYSYQPIVADHALFVRSSSTTKVFRNSVPAVTNGASKPSIRLLAFPNPCSANSSISFSLPCSGTVDFMLLDMAGHTVWTLAQPHFMAGTHTMPVSVAYLPSGTYTLRLRSTNYVASERLIVMK